VTRNSVIKNFFIRKQWVLHVLFHLFGLPTSKFTSPKTINLMAEVKFVKHPVVTKYYLWVIWQNFFVLYTFKDIKYT